MSVNVASLSGQVEGLKGLRAVFRSDLHASRQLYQGESVYLVHDPVAFQTHRLDVLQYTMAVLLDGRLTLNEVFLQLVQNGELVEEDDEFFYEFVVNLYKSGMAVLPIHNGANFYDRYKQIRKLKSKNRWMSLLFLRVPLANPDLFLSRTAPRVNWLFSRWFFFVWLAVGLSALLVLAARFQDFVQPINGILSAGNLPMLWATFIALKLWHELGHGYACKAFGSRVPEMGTILIVGNPLAYVDATAAWSLPERWKRLIVMCGGMYFESLVAIPALFVWALSNDSVLGSLAYQVVLTASVVTILFNANPLMKFDGYFILSELIRLPNLRARADQQLRQVLKQAFLWLPPNEPTETNRNRIVLLVYGVASAAYRVFLVLSISMLIATRFPLVGIAIATFYIGSSLIGTATKVGRYLLTDQETAPVRFRAQIVAMLLLLGTPAALALLPVPFDIVTWGIVGAETEHFVRIDTPGEFQDVVVTPGLRVSEGTPLIHLTNERVGEELRVTEVSLQESALKWEVARDNDVIDSTRIEAEIRALEDQLGEWQRKHRRLQIVAPANGYVLRILPESQRGRFFNMGDPVAVVVNGRPVLRVWLSQDQLNRIVQHVGTSVRYRIPGRSQRTFRGRLKRIEPAAESAFNEQALTILGGGDLMIDPQTGRPLEALFQVEIEPDSNEVALNDHGSRVAVALQREYESIGSCATRRCVRFLRRLLLA